MDGGDCKFEQDERGGVPYPTLSFTLELTRKSHYYLLNILGPCVIMMVLVISVFWLPANSGEKVGIFSYDILSCASEVGSPTNHPGSRQRQDTGGLNLT